MTQSCINNTIVFAYRYIKRPNDGKRTLVGRDTLRRWRRAPTPLDARELGKHWLWWDTRENPRVNCVIGITSAQNKCHPRIIACCDGLVVDVPWTYTSNKQRSEIIHCRRSIIVMMDACDFSCPHHCPYEQPHAIPGMATVVEVV